MFRFRYARPAIVLSMVIVAAAVAAEPEKKAERAARGRPRRRTRVDQHAIKSDCRGFRTSRAAWKSRVAGADAR